MTNDAAESTRVASWRLLLRNPVTVVSAVVLAIVVFIAVTANWIAPFEVNDVNVPMRCDRRAADTGSAPTSWDATCSPACWSPSERPCGSQSSV